MNDIITTVELALLIVLPLIIFYQRKNKSFKSYFLYVVLLYLIWFVTYSLLHELSHVIGSWITGTKIEDYQFIPRFWEGDFKTGYVHSVFTNGFQNFISNIFPYFRDLIFMFIGYFVLKREKITNSFVAGLVIILFVLSPLFDVFNNYFVFVIGTHSDFSNIEVAIGFFWTHAIGLFLTLTGILLLWKVFAIYGKDLDIKLLMKDTLMKAIICTKYGPPEVLQLKEVEKPTPKDNEVLIKIFAVVVGIEDPMQRKGKPYFGRIFVGFTKPRKPILGTEFAGEIEAIGKNVKLFKKGDEVFGSTGVGFGCNAEYMCMPEEGFLSIKLPKISFEEAAPVCGALAAWNLLKAKANIQSGQKVLINDADGSIGSAAVQIAKALGAEVTGVSCTDNLEFVKSLGADRVIDYTTEDITKNGQTYDVILDVTGKSSFSHCKNSLKKRGFYLTTYPTLSVLFQMFWTGIFNGKKVIFSATGLMPVSKRLSFLKDLLLLFEDGKLKTIIDRTYRLDQITEAHQFVEQEHIKGNVVITISNNNND